jgi:hypothetical protein
MLKHELHQTHISPDHFPRASSTSPPKALRPHLIGPACSHNSAFDSGSRFSIIINITVAKPIESVIKS